MFVSKKTATKLALLVICCNKLLFCTAELHAQGKLSRIRNLVRSTPSEDHDDRFSDDEKPKKKKRGQKNNHRGYYGKHRRRPTISLSFLSFPTPDYLSPPPCQPGPSQPTYVVAQSPPGPPLPHADDPEVAETYLEHEDIYVKPAGDYFDWFTRLSVSYGYDFDDLAQGNFALLLQPPGGLGLDTSVAMLRETGSTFRDHLWLGDVNLVYEAIAGDLRGRMGLGVNWLGDAYGGDAGINLTTGFDWRLSSRWVLSGEVDLGSLGDTDLFHGRLSLGRRIDRAEWMFGFNYHDIGGTSVNSAFTGLGFRF